MVIAVACDGANVAEHFGHCARFGFFTAREGSVVERRFVPNPGHKPGFLPVFLHEQGADVIISGGMGQGAVDLFDENGIAVVTGASGDAEAAAQAYLTGTLKSSGNVCSEHEHDGGCEG